MSFDWSEYLNVARQLLVYGTGPQSGEGSLRSAVSRAYYGAFGTARNHLRDRESLVIPRGRNVHIWVRDQFQNSRDAVRKDIGATLNRLREARNKADYRDVVQGWRDMAIKALADAEETIEASRR
ncbi:MAG: HEPN domain-containing protein [Acidobacteria bacterium]|nr:HEPN domain-containing protein [Acidobacteriota bacterium]